MDWIPWWFMALGCLLKGHAWSGKVQFGEEYCDRCGAGRPAAQDADVEDS
jgi:hypothetical protein